MRGIIDKICSDYRSRMISRRRGLRRRRRTGSTLKSRGRANTESAWIWNWNYADDGTTESYVALTSSLPQENGRRRAINRRKANKAEKKGIDRERSRKRWGTRSWRFWRGEQATKNIYRV